MNKGRSWSNKHWKSRELKRLTRCENTTVLSRNTDSNNCLFYVCFFQFEMETLLKGNDKRDEFSCPIVNVHFKNSDVSLVIFGPFLRFVYFTSYSLCPCSCSLYCHERNLCITDKSSSQRFRYHTIIKIFTNFIQRCKYWVRNLCFTWNVFMKTPYRILVSRVQ